MNRRNFLGNLAMSCLLPSVGSSQETGKGPMEFVTHGEVTLATQTFGSPHDPALIMIMGATASMLGWPDAFCTALATRGLFVIRFDHRDTGQSTTVPAGQATYAVEDLAADAVAILDAYEVERAHVLGMSLGGFIGQIVALDHPDRVRSLTLLASEPLGWDGDPLPHIAPEFLEHFARLEELDWSNMDAVTDFLVTSERLGAGSAQAFDEVAMRARIAQQLARTESPASMFNHATTFSEVTSSPSFFFSAPAIAPRTVCDCQPSGGHDLLDGRAVRRAQHGDQRGLLGALARRARLGRGFGFGGGVRRGLLGRRVVAPAGAVFASSGSMPMAARPASVATSVTPWPSPVSRQTGSPLRMSASTS
jgi:pimeloyl-ACP methyl ester carboxylesterase